MQVKFERVAEKHKKDIFEYGQDLEVTKFLTWGPLQNEDQVNIQLLQNQDSWAMICDNKMVGTFSIVNKNVTPWQIGYVLNKKYWNKGLGSKGLDFLIKFIKTNYSDQNKIDARVHVMNISSQKLLEKFNFYIPKDIKDENKDMIIYHLNLK